MVDTGTESHPDLLPAIRWPRSRELSLHQPQDASRRKSVLGKTLGSGLVPSASYTQWGNT